MTAIDDVPVGAILEGHLHRAFKVAVARPDPIAVFKVFGPRRSIDASRAPLAGGRAAMRGMTALSGDKRPL
jgi:hypothetical protein